MWALRTINNSQRGRELPFPERAAAGGSPYAASGGGKLEGAAVVVAIAMRAPCPAPLWIWSVGAIRDGRPWCEVAATLVWRPPTRGLRGVGGGQCGLGHRSMPRPAAALGSVRVQHYWEQRRGGGKAGTGGFGFGSWYWVPYGGAFILAEMGWIIDGPHANCFTLYCLITIYYLFFRILSK